MIAAVLTGPAHWAPNHDEHSIEVYENLGDAMEALVDRYRSNGRDVTITYLDGRTECAAWPAFSIESGFECYILPDEVTPDSLGSDAAIEATLPSVHGGYIDWRLILTTHGDDDDDLAVLAVPA